MRLQVLLATKLQCFFKPKAIIYWRNERCHLSLDLCFFVRLKTLAVKNLKVCDCADERAISYYVNKIAKQQ